MKSFVIHVDNDMKCWQFKENTGVRTESSCEECELTEFLVRENETYQDGTNDILFIVMLCYANSISIGN